MIFHLCTHMDVGSPAQNLYLILNHRWHHGHEVVDLTWSLIVTVNWSRFNCTDHRPGYSLSSIFFSWPELICDADQVPLSSFSVGSLAGTSCPSLLRLWAVMVMSIGRWVNAKFEKKGRKKERNFWKMVSDGGVDDSKRFLSYLCKTQGRIKGGKVRESRIKLVARRVSRIYSAVVCLDYQRTRLDISRGSGCDRFFALPRLLYIPQISGSNFRPSHAYPVDLCQLFVSAGSRRSVPIP